MPKFCTLAQLPTFIGPCGFTSAKETLFVNAFCEADVRWSSFAQGGIVVATSVSSSSSFPFVVAAFLAVNDDDDDGEVCFIPPFFFALRVILG